MVKENNKSIRLQRVYPWVIFVTSFVMVMISLGFGSYTKTTFLKVVTEQLGMERGKFSINDSCRYVTTALLSAVFGKLLMRFGARKLIGFGFCSLTASFAVYSVSCHYWQFYIGGLLLGCGLAFTSTSIVSVVVQNWFEGRHGTLMGIILAANGLGGFIAEQVVNHIIFGIHLDREISEGKWQLAYLVSSIVFLGFGILVILLIRSKPSDMGIVPHSFSKEEKKEKALRKTADAWAGLSLKELIKKPYLYFSAISFFFCGFMLQALVGISKTHMQDVGIGMNTITFYFSLHAFFLLGAKVLCGIIYDHFGLKVVYLLCGISALIALFSVLVVSPTRSYFVFIYSFISAFALPLETIMVPLYCKEVFGQKENFRILGYFIAICTAGMAFGAPAVNFVYDLTGQYTISLVVLICLMAIALLLGLVAIRLADADRKRIEKESQKIQS